jgi:hypothetical protein
MICETIFTLAENFDHPYRMGRITKQAQTGVRHWIDSIYDNAWKKQCDEWIMRDGITMMYLDGIKFIVCPNLLWPFDPANQTLWRAAFPGIVPDHYINLDPGKSPQAICGNNPFLEKILAITQVLQDKRSLQKTSIRLGTLISNDSQQTAVVLEFFLCSNSYSLL